MRNKIITSFFCLLLAVSALIGLLMPDRYYSEREKRTLTQKPKFTVADFISGKFSGELEKYLTDQVPLRDGWVTMKTYMELAIGKRESGGVYICKDKYLMDKFTSYSKKQLAANAAALADLQEKLAAEGVSMNTILVPMAAQVLTEKLPAYAPVADYTAILQVLTDAGVDTTDVFFTLAAHSSENIYYRTDHHWTSLGAYYAYQQLCGALGLTPFDPAAHTALTAENFYGTHYSKARTWNAVPDTITYYELQNALTIWNVTGPGQPTEGTTTGLYDTDKLNVYDKYAMFLHGNNGLSRVEGDGSGKILVLKDSYANCFVPYLTANYAAVDVVDFRNYNYGLDQLIADNDYDQILVLYSFDSFKGDPYLYRAGVAG
mgnify:CR=1 FL=1